MGRSGVKMGGGRKGWEEQRWLKNKEGFGKSHAGENVKLSVAHLKKTTKAKGSDGKAPRKLPPEDWDVKERGDIPRKSEETGSGLRHNCLAKRAQK